MIFFTKTMKRIRAEEELIQWRETIDNIDDNIIAKLKEISELCEKRGKATFQIGLIKKQIGLPIFNKEREEEILTKYGEYVEFIKSVLEDSREAQEKIVNSK